MSLSNMSTEEIKAERKKISHQISEFKIKLREIEDEERKRIKKDLKQYVGKCYAVRPQNASLSSAPVKYSKIIEIPQEQYTMTATIFNGNQLPAFSFWVNDQKNILGLGNHFKRESFDETEFGFNSDTVPLEAISKNRVYGSMDYQEITSKEFNKALEKHLKCLYSAVTGI